MDEEFKSTFAATLSQPKQKYPEPMTSNQEIGWDWNEIKKKETKWKNSKVQCKETTYAANYITMSHKSPFVKKS